MAPLAVAEETCWAADLPLPHPEGVCGPDSDRIPPRGRLATSVLAPTVGAESSLISRSPSRARISVSVAPERAVLVAPIPAAASSSVAACGISLPRRCAAPLRASCDVVAVGGTEGVETERVLFIGTQFSILYTSMYSPAETATPRA